MSESSGCCTNDQLGASATGSTLTLWRPEFHTQGVAGAPAPWRHWGGPFLPPPAFCGSVFLGSLPHPSARCLPCCLAGLYVAVSSHTSSCKDTSGAGLRAHPDPARHCLNLIPAANTPFLAKSHSHVPRDTVQPSSLKAWSLPDRRSPQELRWCPRRLPRPLLWAGTPEAWGHREKDMAPWPHESHWGQENPARRWGWGGSGGLLCRQAPEESLGVSRSGDAGTETGPGSTGQQQRRVLGQERWGPQGGRGSLCMLGEGGCPGERW